MAVAGKPDLGARGRRVALFIAAVGVYWILAFEIGDQYGLSQRTRALLDLIALAGFAFGLWLGYGLWRDSRKDGD
jgi:threonine/homoserine/homoserine lactone efflux protein